MAEAEGQQDFEYGIPRDIRRYLSCRCAHFFTSVARTVTVLPAVDSIVRVHGLNLSASILISCDPGNVGRIQQIAQKYGIAAEMIGETIPDRLEISLDGRTVISAPVGDLSAAYEGALESALSADSELVTAR